MLLATALDLRGGHPEVFRHAQYIALADPDRDVELLGDEELRDLIAEVGEVLAVS
jgi:hypothetical protein